MTDCFYQFHFTKTPAGLLTPQPWMQWRQVASVSAQSREGSFPISGGVAKNVVLQTVISQWRNLTGMDQWVYGMVTRGGCRVTLQARSRAFLSMGHSQAAASVPGTPVEVSRMGIGAAVGTAGAFATNAYGIAEQRQNSITMPLRPDLPGMTRVVNNGWFAGAVELRFISEFWESNTVDGGTNNTESSYSTGDTRLDLFAIPAL